MKICMHIMTPRVFTPDGYTRWWNLVSISGARSPIGKQRNPPGSQQKDMQKSFRHHGFERQNVLQRFMGHVIETSTSESQ